MIGFERRLLVLGVLLVVGLFLRQVFLNLLHVLVAFGGRREHAGDVERLEVRVCSLLSFLDRLEHVEVFDGVVDRSRGQDGVELASAGGGVVLGENGFDDLLFA